MLSLEDQQSTLVSPGAHELLVVIEGALDASDGNANVVAGVLRVLLQSGEAPHDADCSLLANVLGNATQVSNDPSGGS